MQVASLTSAKGLCDPTGTVKSALNGPQVRCAIEADLTASVGSHGPLVPVR